MYSALLVVRDNKVHWMGVRGEHSETHGRQALPISLLFGAQKHMLQSY